jgi:hypothetical protein
MTSVVTAAAEATERTNAVVTATALMLKVGDFMRIIPTSARRCVKTFYSMNDTSSGVPG